MTSIQIQHIIGQIGQIGQLLSHQKSSGLIAVVNAANSGLRVGGGVTGALVRAVGGGSNWDSLMNNAQNMEGLLKKKHLNVTDVAFTSTQGQLLTDQVQYIIHALGPVAGYEEIELITPTIINVLKMADHLQIQTLILPAISGGIFSGGDPTWATRIRQLIQTAINSYIDQYSTQIEYIYLISFDHNDQKLWETPTPTPTPTPDD